MLLLFALLLQLLGVACLGGQTPREALKAATQQQQQQQQQQLQQQQSLEEQLEVWGVYTPQSPSAVFETFEGLLQAVCPTEFQRIQQQLLLQQLQQQQQQQQ